MGITLLALILLHTVRARQWLSFSLLQSKTHRQILEAEGDACPGFVPAAGLLSLLAWKQVLMTFLCSRRHSRCRIDLMSCCRQEKDFKSKVLSADLEVPAQAFW